MSRRRLLLVAALAAACSRKDPPAAPDAGGGPLVSSAPDAQASTPASTPTAGFSPTTVLPVEARRLRVGKIAEAPLVQLGAAPAGAPNAADALEKHFAGVAGPFDVQLAQLTASGRRALLMMKADTPTSEARPALFVLDDAGAAIWSKDRPFAGILPPVGPVAIAAAPKGRVALAACDPPTSLVALRILDHDGFPFADFQAMSSVDSCEALALLYWPEHGWILATAGPGVTRARLVDENGSGKWGAGLDLGVRSRPGAISAPSLAVLTDDSFVLVQVAQPTAAPGSPFHALAFRYDLLGAPLWKEAVDLGEIARPEKLTVVPLRPGARVTLPSGTAIDVTPSGDRISRGRAP